MDIVKIINKKAPLYTAFEELYRNSFPPFEQRTEEQQIDAFSSPYYHLNVYRKNESLIGFISYWDFNTYLYIEHFAIHNRHRGKEYGHTLLKEFVQEGNKIVILEIDPVVDEISAARFRFYQKCNFYENPYNHIHPPYREEFPGHALRILTTGRTITDDEYQRFRSELKECVMTKNSESSNLRL